MESDWKYIFYCVLGFLSGSILFGYELPRLMKGVDVRRVSADGNPGTYNAFVYGGVVCGILTLLAELGKGFWPVALCMKRLGGGSMLFAAVMAAPVLGHAFSVFHRGQGGKAIAVSFGVLLGLLPVWPPLALLIGWFLFFSLIRQIKDHGRRTAATFGCFALSGIFFIRPGAVRLGSLLMSAVVLYRHRHAILEIISDNRRLKTE